MLTTEESSLLLGFLAGDLFLPGMALAKVL